MKNTILPLLIAVTMISFSASSQIQKGNLLVGGNIGNVNLGLNDPKIFSVILPRKLPGLLRTILPWVAMRNSGLKLQSIQVPQQVMELVLSGATTQALKVKWSTTAVSLQRLQQASVA